MAEAKKVEHRKYSVKPPRDLQSKFILKMEARKRQEEEDERLKQLAEEEERQAVSVDFFMLCFQLRCYRVYFFLTTEQTNERK